MLAGRLEREEAETASSARPTDVSNPPGDIELRPSLGDAHRDDPEAVSTLVARLLVLATQGK
jgi:hypothetical protein